MKTLNDTFSTHHFFFFPFFLSFFLPFAEELRLEISSILILFVHKSQTNQNQTTIKQQKKLTCISCNTAEFAVLQCHDARFLAFRILSTLSTFALRPNLPTIHNSHFTF